MVGRDDGSLALLLDRLEPGPQRSLGTRLVALAERAAAEGRPIAGPFMDEADCRLARLMFDGRNDFALRFYGGYRRSLRRRIVIIPRRALEEVTLHDVAVALWMRPEGAAAGGSVDGDDADSETGRDEWRHRFRALGFEEDEIGDVMPSREGGGQAVVAKDAFERREIGEPVEVGGRSFTVEVIDFERLDAPPQSVKDVQTTVASLRLDAVAGSGFGLSRSKMATEIKAGRVRLNWQVVQSPSRSVQAGDIISVPGRGKVLVVEVGSPTRKRRLPVTLQLIRYG